VKINNQKREFTYVRPHQDKRPNVEGLIYLSRLLKVLDSILDPESSDPGEVFVIPFRIA
jgi:hypothetical protein